MGALKHTDTSQAVLSLKPLVIYISGNTGMFSFSGARVVKILAEFTVTHATYLVLNYLH